MVSGLGFDKHGKPKLRRKCRKGSQFKIEAPLLCARAKSLRLEISLAARGRIGLVRNAGDGQFVIPRPCL